jgi:transposase InsO family protein
VFLKQPTGQQVSEMLDRAVERVGQAPKYTVTDQGPQFWSDYLAWCERHGVKPRYGAVGQHGSIAVIERFFLTLKSEAMRVIMVERADQRVGSGPGTPLTSGKPLALKVSYLEGRKHLPIVELKAAA